MRSTIGQQEAMRATIHGLGLKGPGSSVVVGNTPSFRGAIKKVMHLVRVEEVDHG
jgi:large subunit ribosomal protein L30